MNNDFKRRIEALEAKFVREPVTIHLPDGSQRVIRGDNRHYFELMNAGFEMVDDAGHFRPNIAHPLCSELEAVRNAIRFDEPAGMFNLLWAMLQDAVRPGKPVTIERTT
jgi:hypothetical protein